MELSFSRCSLRCVIATSLLLLTLPAFSQIAKGDRLLSNGAVPSTGSLEPLATAGYNFSSVDSDFNVFAGAIAADYLQYATGSLALGGGLYYNHASVPALDYGFTQIDASIRLRYGWNVTGKIHVYSQISPSYQLEITKFTNSTRSGQTGIFRIIEKTAQITPSLGTLVRLNQHAFADFSVGFSLLVSKSVGGSATEASFWSDTAEELYTQTSNALRVNVSPIARFGAGGADSASTSLATAGIAKGSWLVGGSGASLTIRGVGSSVRTPKANDIVINASAYKFVNRRLAVGGELTFQRTWDGQFSPASIINVRPAVRYYLAPAKLSTLMLGAGVAVSSDDDFASRSSSVGVQLDALYVLKLRPGVFGEFGPALSINRTFNNIFSSSIETGTYVGFIAGLQFALAGRSKLDQ